MGVFGEFVEFLVLFFGAIFKGIFHFFVRPEKKYVADDVVLITGAAKGIGRLLTLSFVKLGSKVVIWDVDEKGLRDVVVDARQFGGGDRVFPYVWDLGSRDNIKETAAKVTSDVGHVTILINNAGMVIGRDLRDLEEEEIEKVIDVNLMAHFWTIKCFLPEMIRRRYGHLVTISSSAGIVSLNRLADYCASKAGCSSLLEAVHYELKKDNIENIHTTLVCPYLIDTGLFKGATTRFSWLFPKLQADQTVDRIMDAILTNQNMVCIPRIIYFLGVAKMLLPVAALDSVHKFFGASSMMDTFEGRKEEE